MITHVSEKETRLAYLLREMTEALDRTTKERDAARNDALEQAAVVCEGMRDSFAHSSKRPWPGDYAYAIRALKEPT
jgi:hypothetical protein